MSENEKHSSDEWLPGTPPDLKQSAQDAENDLLPTKSRALYESTYEACVKWKRDHKTKLTSESVFLAYFTELSKKFQPSTLWVTYLMLKKVIKRREQIDFDTYHKFKAFMKKQSTGFTSKKSNVLSSEEVQKFLSEAPDNEYLAKKVALIFGISGACRSKELVNIKLLDIKRQGEILVVNIPTTKKMKPRFFVITEDCTKTVQKYIDLRPPNTSTDRFFLNFKNGKCTNQVIGVHTFAKMPRDIATFLELENPASYTGHAFRRTSATILADSGANITTLKRYGGWKSATVAEGYIEESIQNKSKIGNIISTAVNLISDQSSKLLDINIQQPKRQKTETRLHPKKKIQICK